MYFLNIMQIHKYNIDFSTLYTMMTRKYHTFSYSNPTIKIFLTDQESPALLLC